MAGSQPHGSRHNHQRRVDHSWGTSTVSSCMKEDIFYAHLGILSQCLMLPWSKVLGPKSNSMNQLLRNQPSTGVRTTKDKTLKVENPGRKTNQPSPVLQTLVLLISLVSGLHWNLGAPKTVEKLNNLRGSSLKHLQKWHNHPSSQSSPQNILQINV